jgi:hypothetical protein
MIKTNFQFDLLMKKIFTLCCSLLSMISMAQVGIGTTDPKATLDIQGSPAQNNITDGIIAPRITGNQLQAKTYTTEHVGALLYVTEIPTAASGQVAEINTPGYYYFDGSTWKQSGNNIFGDVKSGFQTTDHDGWILLNGRNVSLLTASQQLRASQLGFSTTIPNANSAYLVQNGTGLGTLSNDNSKTIVRANLPNVNITATTTTNGDHNHTFGTRWSGTGQAGIVRDQNSNAASTSNTSTAGNHNHTVTFNLNGNVPQQELDVRPLSLSVNMFVFLGL